MTAMERTEPIRDGGFTEKIPISQCITGSEAGSADMAKSRKKRPECCSGPGTGRAGTDGEKRRGNAGGGPVLKVKLCT